MTSKRKTALYGDSVIDAAVREYGKLPKWMTDPVNRRSAHGYDRNGKVIISGT